MITRSLKPVAKREPRTPEAHLAQAMDATTPELRMLHAKAGLAYPKQAIHVETHMLLLRQVYRAHLDQRQLRAARDVARQMAALGPLADVAYHDAARACFALGEVEDAVREQRLATLAAPEDRRAFHAWSLATFEHFAGDSDAALASLERAERWTTDDHALVRAHRAYIEIERGRPVDEAELERITRELPNARRGKGYGEFLLGMIASLRGDAESARANLTAFVRRAESGSPAKALTLREELRRARHCLAALDRP